MLIMMVPYWKSVPLQMAFHILKICPITNGIPHIENLSHFKWHSTYWKSVPLQTAFHKGPFLGPLLIIIYIKDIHEASSNFKIICRWYKFDKSSVCLATQHLPKTWKWRKYQNINNKLNSITEWLNIKKLSLNVMKTKLMLFHYH